MIVSIEGKRGRSESQLSILPGGDHSWSSGTEPVEPVSLEDSSLEKDNGTSPCLPSLFLGFAFQAYFSQDSLQSGPQCNFLGEGLCPHLGSERLFNPRGSSPGPVRDPSLLGGHVPQGRKAS